MDKITRFLFVISMMGVGTVAIAGAPVAPVAPWSPNVNTIVVQWSKMFHKNLTREEALKATCPFPSEATVGVKAYPGSVLVNMGRGGGSASDGDDVPMVALATKAPLDEVIAWYKKHYPNLKPKYMFETAGPGIEYFSTKGGLVQQESGANAVGSQAGDFGGCGGLIAAPVKDGYQTGIRIYYKPHKH